MTSEDVTNALRDIQGVADAFYGGRTERGFLHWALGCVLGDIDPADEELIAHTALDGSGDLGTDGYWVDEANNRLVLLQSKFQQRIRRDDAVAFRGSIQSLLDQDYVQRHGNAAINDIYPDLFELLIDENYSMNAVLACGGAVASAARTYASGEG